MPAMPSAAGRVGDVVATIETRWGGGGRAPVVVVRRGGLHDLPATGRTTRPRRRDRCAAGVGCRRRPPAPDRPRVRRRPARPRYSQRGDRQRFRQHRIARQRMALPFAYDAAPTTWHELFQPATDVIGESSPSASAVGGRRPRELSPAVRRSPVAELLENARGPRHHTLGPCAHMTSALGPAVSCGHHRRGATGGLNQSTAPARTAERPWLRRAASAGTGAGVFMHGRG